MAWLPVRLTGRLAEGAMKNDWTEADLDALLAPDAEGLLLPPSREQIERLIAWLRAERARAEKAERILALSQEAIKACLKGLGER